MGFLAGHAVLIRLEVDGFLVSRAGGLLSARCGVGRGCVFGCVRAREGEVRERDAGDGGIIVGAG